MPDLHYLTDEKRDALRTLEKDLLAYPDVQFCGVSFNPQTGGVLVVLGGASVSRMGVHGTHWIQRIQQMLPDIPFSIQLVRGQLKEAATPE